MHQHVPTTIGELFAHLDPRLSGHHCATVHHQIEIVLGLGDEEGVSGGQVANLRDLIAHHTARDLPEHDKAALGLALDACDSWLDKRCLCFDCGAPAVDDDPDGYWACADHFGDFAP